MYRLNTSRQTLTMVFVHGRQSMWGEGGPAWVFPRPHHEGTSSKSRFTVEQGKKAAELSQQNQWKAVMVCGLLRDLLYTTYPPLEYQNI